MSSADPIALLERRVQGLHNEADKLEGEHVQLAGQVTNLSADVGAVKSYITISKIGILTIATFIMGLLWVVVGKASGESMTVVEARVNRVEQQQAAQTEAIASLRKSTDTLTLAIERLTNKLDELRVPPATKPRKAKP